MTALVINQKHGCFLGETFQSLEIITVVALTSPLTPSELRAFDEEPLAMLQEAVNALFETHYNALFLSCLSLRYEIFVIQESFKLTTNFTELRRGLQKNHKGRAQRYNNQSCSVTLEVRVSRVQKKWCTLIHSRPKTDGSPKKHVIVAVNVYYGSTTFCSDTNSTQFFL